MNLVLPKPGNYVVAVSGGVDSMALLHRLQGQPGLKLVVAHFDHGIREDSREDRLLVQTLARQYGLPFAYDEGRLGAGASEAVARKARYKFLRHMRRASNARAIITAHHQDDALETAIMNILRGTGRKGLTSLKSRPGIERPLLHLPKNELIAYAREQGLNWHEDSTNQDQVHLRNYIRHNILPRFSEQDRTRLWELITKLHSINHELDTLLVNQLHFQSVSGSLDRQWFNHLPHVVAREVMAAWLREHGVRNFDKKSLERLVVAAKVNLPGRQINVLQNASIIVADDRLALAKPER